MTDHNTNGLLRNVRRAGPPALLAACLSIAPAFAQSTTTTVVEPEQSDTTKTTIREKPNGDTVIKEKQMDREPDVIVRERDTIEAPSSTTTIVR